MYYVSPEVELIFATVARWTFLIWLYEETVGMVRTLMLYYIDVHK